MRAIAIWVLCGTFGWIVGTVCSVSNFSILGTSFVIVIVGAALGKIIWDYSDLTSKSKTDTSTPS